MISILKNILTHKFLTAVVLIAGGFFLVPTPTLAQDALSLSVSPTLFDMAAEPSQKWTSVVRVINPNAYPITVYAEVVNFRPDGEVGQGKFVPVVADESQGQTMAEWISITTEAIEIQAEQTIELPFVITVPENAPPGGHFAALLIGTRPPEDDETLKVRTSQIVTTLLFLRVSGDVVEAGNIRSFRSLNTLVESPEATLELRFENTGNVHILPQGEIKITNMWGQERGLIPINRSSLFGNVLPSSTRKYTYTWTGEPSFADMGKYTALATIAYGESGRQFASQEISFWVIPWKALLGTLVVLGLFVYLVMWLIKLYIRKMLSMVAQQHSLTPDIQHREKRTVPAVVAPIEAGILDLRGQWQHSVGVVDRIKTLFVFAKNYRLFFLMIGLLLLFIFMIVAYVKTVSSPERAYDITIDGLSEDVKISSEEMKYQRIKDEAAAVTLGTPDESLPKILIVNRSGISGLAVDLRLRLEERGYQITEIQNDLGVAEENTVIVYDPAVADEALVLSQEIYGALLSAFAGDKDAEALITVYVGKDLENAVQ